jgi:hypothetical protein
MAHDDEFLLPTASQRTVIVGRTGSGKTQFAAWLLSNAPFNHQPYIIVDYKRDALLNASRRINEIGYKDLPSYPGLYIIHPDPTHDEIMEQWLYRIWRKGHTGLFFDEAYMVPNKKAFPSLLTQGRSLHIPAIVVSQRPVWLSRFAFSEADQFSVFHLNDHEDRRTISRFLPEGAADERPAEYHSIWYDVPRDQLFRLQPVPDGATILQAIEDRLTPRRRAI